MLLFRAELLFSVMDQGLPFRKWDSKTLVAWLEVWVGVPFWYIAAIRNCLENGEMLSVSVLLFVAFYTDYPLPKPLYTNLLSNFGFILKFY